ncbi:trifunctional histidinol dehydrogenase [Globomyces sp. JEL0801]|nr:trifunctional histidinol dehydrogenase [Globomyces sp. JEL0801]
MYLNSQVLNAAALASTVLINEGVSRPSNSNSLWIKSNFKDSFTGIVSLLDSGADVVVINFKHISNMSATDVIAALDYIDSNRLALEFQPDKSDYSKGPNMNAFTPIFKHFIIVQPPAKETILNLKVNFPNNDFYIEDDNALSYKDDLERGFNLVLQASKLQLGNKESDKVNFVDLLLLNCKSDRPDGLFTTIVVDEQGIALGLCYSNEESVTESLKTGTGVYHSRNRGLWYKGKTSGATQTLLGVAFDCDSDTFRFSVVQKEPGFCHLNTRTCFGEDKGISGLYRTLINRLENAPEKSYTKRLFEDKTLLHSKITEEAEELCTAKSQDEVAWEAADLLYFALVKCVSEGVSLADIEKHLDKRSKKITRRPGNAKPAKTVAVPAAVSNSVSEPYKPFVMETYNLKSLVGDDSNKILSRPIMKTAEILDRVRPIVDSVRKNGDAALKELTFKFDKVKLDSVVMKQPFDESLMKLDPEVKKSIDLAYQNIEKFHVAQLDKETLVVETMPGVVCSRFARPIEIVGLYIPGGTAVLPSTALMLGIPAKAAQCHEIVFATPPRPDGSICPEVVYVAHLVGASMIVMAGGAQAVAAMAYGTESVPKVDKICGPGNQYVTAAKMIAQSDSSALCSIDMPAGPSELLVVADESANPRYVIADLLSQAEHGEDSQVILVAVNLSESQIQGYQEELYKQGTALPRAEIAKVAISHSYIITVDTMEEAIEFSNRYAPEHLILNVSNAEKYVEKVLNAGSIFVGPYAAESCGDYASGTNHTLPTYGYARMYSGVNTNSFVKHITSQTITAAGLDAIGDAVATLAGREGLQAHRNAVVIRLEDIRRK